MSDDIGNTVLNYNKIMDVDLTTGTNTASVTVPIGSGYAVDVVSTFTSDHGIHNKLLKYGNIDGITVNSGVNSTVSITLHKITTILSAPATVPTGSTYSVTIANFGFPLDNTDYYRTGLLAFTDNAFTTGTALGPGVSFTGDTIANATDPSITHYFQAVFFIDSAFLNPSDIATNWTYYYPDLSLTPADPQVSTTVQPPGSLPINVTL